MTGTGSGIPAADESVLTEICDVIGAARSVLLAAHINPDADALGSCLALGLGLERRGVQVAVAFAEPERVPESLRELPGQHLIRPLKDLPPDFDLLISLDVGSVERLGELKDFVGRTPTVVIDHHPSNTRFGTYNLVDAEAEATVVVVHRILGRLGIDIDPMIADDLYAGLATDTAMFRYVGPATHLLADELVRAGARPREVMAPIIDTHPFDWFAMLSHVLGRAVLDPGVAGGRGMVHTCVTLADAAGLRQEELDSVIDIVRTAREAAIGVVAKQTGAERWQVSLRSRDGVDVSVAAAELGGGGHTGAAGFTWHGDYLGAIEALTAALG